jgi:ABC-type nitrate/sulfonate/bicarbonate transport system substrate-binding protein
MGSTGVVGGLSGFIVSTATTLGRVAELFARESIRSIPDLKGKNVGVQSLGSPQHLFINTMAAHCLRPVAIKIRT